MVGHICVEITPTVDNAPEFGSREQHDTLSWCGRDMLWIAQNKVRPRLPVYLGPALSNDIKVKLRASQYRLAVQSATRRRSREGNFV
jgi:hypothetical protein